MPVLSKKEFKDYVVSSMKELNLTPTTLGLLSYNSHHIIFDIMNGRECKERIKNKIISFIKEYKKLKKRFNQGEMTK